MAELHLPWRLVANSQTARQKVEQSGLNGNPGIGADDTPCKRDRVSGSDDAECIRQRQQHHRSFEEVDEMITEHLLSPSDLAIPLQQCGSSPFPDVFAPCRLFPDLIAISCCGPKLGAKRIAVHDRAAPAMNRKRSLQGFRQDFLIGGIFDKAAWARAPYFLVTSFCREGRRRHGFAGSGGSSVATKTGHRTGDHR